MRNVRAGVCPRCGRKVGPGQRRTVAVNQKTTRQNRQIIAKLSFFTIDLIFSQDIDQANEDLLHRILDIRRGQALVHGPDEVPHGSRIELDKGRPFSLVIALSQFGDLLQEGLWCFGKHGRQMEN